MNDEKTLLQRARDFEEQALAEVYDTYSPKLYRYALRLLADEDLAEECVADTFSRFLKAMRNGIGPQQHLQAYLYRIAHNWITDTFRRQPPPSIPLEYTLQAGDEPDPSDLVGEKIDQERVRTALRLLTPDQRQVVILRFIEDMQNQDIAAAMDKPIGAVKALQHRALSALRRILFMEIEQ
jgi:RNA polymerase sigma-70 factor (ECF subfamily)